MPAGSRMPSHSGRASQRMRSRRCYWGKEDRRGRGGGEGEVLYDGTSGRARSPRTCRRVWACSSCPSCSCAARRSSLRRRRRGIEVEGSSSQGKDRRFLHDDIDWGKRKGGWLFLYLRYALGHASVRPIRGIIVCAGGG